MLQLILGRSGSGKTEFVFSKIKQLIDNGENNILLITPEQYSFVSERRLLRELGEDRVNSVENGSFSRLSNEIFNRYGGESLPVLSKGSKAVVFKQVCDCVKDELKLFGKNTDNNAFINSAIKIYDEMKSCRVDANDIMLASQQTEKETLSQKLYDISVIMSAYDSYIEGKYLDCASELTRLYEKLLDLDYFKDRIVFIDGFNGFVAQEYKILEVILNQAKTVYVTFCTDSYNSTDKYSLFSYVNSNIIYLNEAAKNAGAQVAEPIFLRDNHRAKNDELALVERLAFANVKNSYDYECSNVSLYCAKSITDECDYVSTRICDLLRSGVKASDIVVICRDLDKYQKELQFSFSKYNIPYFNDERQNISSHPLIMFVNFLMRCAVFSYSSNDIFSMLKTGLTALSDDDINDLENYAFIWNINGSKWKNDFVNSANGFSEEMSDRDKSRLEAINVSRRYVAQRLERFVSSCKKKSSAEICKAIYFTLLDFSVDKGVERLAKSLNENGKSVLAFEQGRVWDLLMDILDKLSTISTDEPITVKEFYKYFNLMISNEDLGSVPAGLDNVQIGSADRVRCDNPYAVFVVGANEGEFPQSVSSSGLLSESDRSILIENKFKLYSYGEVLNAQEKYFAYMALTCATDRLFVSYRGGFADGAESIIVSEIKDIFSKIRVDCSGSDLGLNSLYTDANAFEILASNYYDNTEFIATLKKYFLGRQEYGSRLSAVERLSSNADISIKNTDLAKQLFGKNMYLSVSKIEDYYKCAFRYYCKFGINARPRIKAELNPMATGSVIHYVLECVIREVGSQGLLKLDDCDISRLTNKYLNDYLENKMGDSSQFTKRFKFQFMRLERMITYVIARMRDEFECSDFEPKAFELAIGNGAENEPVKSQVIELADGGTIQIKGYIDRVDTFVQDGVQYVRVVDYKSGIKKFRLSDILSGLNLQMFVYLFTLCKSNHDLSGTQAGVLYLHSSRSIYNVSRGNSTNEIADSDNKSYKMPGVVLNDDEHQIAQHMEHDLKGRFIDVKCTAKNGISGSIVSLEDMGRISRKIDSLIEQMGMDLHMGKILQNPVNSPTHSNTCENCDYSAVCANKKEIILKELCEPSFNDVLKILKEDEENA